MKWFRASLLTITSFLFLSVVGLFLGKSFAATKPQITVSPFLQNVKIVGNRTNTFKINYTNNTAQPQRLDLTVADFGSLDETGGVAFTGQEFSQLLDKYTLSKWIKLSASSIKLSPNQTKSIVVTIINDATMGPGGHYGAVLAKASTPEAKGKITVNLKQKISTLIFAVKTGGEKYDLGLEKIETNGTLYKLPTEAYLTIKALGNVHIAPRGVVYVKDSSGKVISKGAINQESGYALPDTDRIFTVPLNKISRAKFWITKYTLQVDYRYDGLEKFASKSSSIFYLSLWWLAIIVGCVVVIIKRNYVVKSIKTYLRLLLKK